MGTPHPNHQGLRVSNVPLRYLTLFSTFHLSIYLSVCLSVCLCVCVCVCVYVCMFVSASCQAQAFTQNLYPGQRSNLQMFYSLTDTNTSTGPAPSTHRWFHRPGSAREQPTLLRLDLRFPRDTLPQSYQEVAKDHDLFLFHHRLFLVFPFKN